MKEILIGFLEACLIFVKDEFSLEKAESYFDNLIKYYNKYEVIDMNMEFERKLTIPAEVKEQFPVTGKVAKIVEEKRAEVFMPSDQVSLAIGKGGCNIKLASKLSGYEIDVFRDDLDSEEDVDLDEFTDVFDQWVIDEFKKIGCDTAKSVLKVPREELIQRTDLEEETVDEVISSNKKEFDLE